MRLCGEAAWAVGPPTRAFPRRSRDFSPGAWLRWRVGGRQAARARPLRRKAHDRADVDTGLIAPGVPRALVCLVSYKFGLAARCVPWPCPTSLGASRGVGGCRGTRPGVVLGPQRLDAPPCRVFVHMLVCAAVLRCPCRGDACSPQWRSPASPDCCHHRS